LKNTKKKGENSALEMTTEELLFHRLELPLHPFFFFKEPSKL